MELLCDRARAPMNLILIISVLLMWGTLGKVEPLPRAAKTLIEKCDSYRYKSFGPCRNRGLVTVEQLRKAYLNDIKDNLEYFLDWPVEVVLSLIHI